MKHRHKSAIIILCALLIGLVSIEISPILALVGIFALIGGYNKWMA